MQDIAVGRALRMVRIRSNRTQDDVAGAARLSRATIGRDERGQLDRHHLHTVRQHAAALGLRVEVELRGLGAGLPRLLDEEHAAIVEYVAALLRSAGWLVEPEASFSIRGERGRLDLLGFHPASDTLVITEAKPEIADMQGLFGGLNVKRRLAPQLARARGWTPTSISILLAVAGSDAARARVAAHPASFAEFSTRGASARRWLNRPTGPVRMLLWVPPSAAARRSGWVAGRTRVRPARAAASVTARGETVSRSSTGRQARTGREMRQ